MKRLLLSAVLASLFMMPAVGFSQSTKLLTTTEVLKMINDSAFQIPVKNQALAIQKECQGNYSPQTQKCYLKAVSDMTELLQSNYIYVSPSTALTIIEHYGTVKSTPQ